jgi:hypothetical protein
MDTNEIKDLLQNVPNFIGVFPIDKLPKLNVATNAKLVVNLDPSNLPGTHWVAIALRDGKGYYFDSYGDFPPMEIQQWLARNSRDWTYNSTVLQSPSSLVCGHLCVNFLKRFV